MKKIITLSCLSALLVFSGKSFAQSYGNIGTTTGFNGQILCLLADNTNNALYAGGYFTAVDGVAASNIAMWDGNSWSAMGSGFTAGPFGTGIVYSLAMHNGDLYAGGDFTASGGTTVNKIARWNGSAWVAVGTGMSTGGTYDYVSSMTSFNNILYAAGEFTTAGGSSIDNVAQWNGSSWSSVGGNSLQSGYHVSSLLVHNNELYAGGAFFFNYTNNDFQYRIAKLSNNSWLNVGTKGLGDANNLYDVKALATYNGDLYTGGYFNVLESGSTVANHVAKWNGSAWSAMGSGSNAGINIAGSASTPPVYALMSYGNKLYVGGNYTSAGGSAASDLATWDGTSWGTAGSGLNGRVQAMAVFNNSLVLGGSFSSAGGMNANNIASWTVAGAGIDEQSKAIAVSVMPNPFTSEAVVTIDSKVELQNAELSIYDMLGKKINTIKAETNNIPLERTGMQGGMYFYTLSSNGNTVATGKLMVE